MRRTLFALVIPCAVLALVAQAPAADTIDNPAYQMWAKWKEGAFVTLKTEVASEGVQLVTIQTQTLKKLTAEKAVIEMTGSTEVAGMKIQAPVTSADVPAKFPKVNFDPKTVPAESKDGPRVKETKGRETLTIKGKQLACDWVQHELEGGIVSKTWFCDDVPGRMVKMEARTKEGSSTMVLTDWKAEKK